MQESASTGICKYMLHNSSSLDHDIIDETSEQSPIDLLSHAIIETPAYRAFFLTRITIYNNNNNNNLLGIGNII